MIYLKEFATAADYNAAKSGLIAPNVSYIVDGTKVEYMKKTPTPPAPTPTHDCVDLGLPSGTKWATMNIGASNETGYGNFYQYGKGAAQYAATSGESAYQSDENPLAASADTATQVWDNTWHMPTKAQLEELTGNTTLTWEENFNGSGVNGAKFTSKTDSTKYVFFPAAGYYYEESESGIGTVCRLWSSTPMEKTDYGLMVYYLDVMNFYGTIYCEIVNTYTYGDGCSGPAMSVRGVMG